MRNFIITYKEKNKSLNIGDIVRNANTHEIFVVEEISETSVFGSKFGETDIGEVCVVNIGIQPLNKYTDINALSLVSTNPFLKIKNKILKNKWLEEEDYCNKSFIHFNSKKSEIEMISKVGTIISGNSEYFHNTFKYVML